MGAILMAMAPFFPEPHLVEKFNMFKNGTLTKPLDIFDVFWHFLPAILIGLKYYTSQNENGVEK